LHARDSERPARGAAAFEERGNTVIVVEHDPTIIAGADHSLELGPRCRESLGGSFV
jgi:excinuclease UvrABC ATPase subunit